MRKDKSVSGTKSILRKGYWPYSTPLGYDNKNKFSTADRHEYVINDKGLLIQQAFKWKASGSLTNNEIVNKLKLLGLNVTLRNLAWIFANTFYCGYVNSSLLPGEVIKGKHPPLIDEQTFIIANNISRSNPISGIPKKHKIDELPLKVFARDAKTESPFTGYLHKQKKIYYYKTRGTGTAVNVSARKLNELFVLELQKFEYQKLQKSRLTELLTKKMKTQFKDKTTDMTLHKKRISELQTILENLEERYILNEITREQYGKFNQKYIKEKSLLEGEVAKSYVLSSNLEKAIKKGLEIAENISQMWLVSDYSQKQKLQKLIFPDGILYDKENNTVLTNEINSLFAEIPILTTVSEKNKGGISDRNLLQCSNVGETGQCSNFFLKDLIALHELLRNSTYKIL